MNKKWDKNSLEKKLRELDYWHFLIELYPGFFNVPRGRWKGIWHNIIVQDYITRTLLPILDMLNKTNKSNTTILDIGCNEGWLSLVFYRAGYKRIVGIDPNEGNIKRANFLKEYFNMENVEFHQADINDFKTNEKFDFSIMLGVINHTHNPVGILRNIHSFTDKYLILDFDSFCKDYIESSTGAKFDTGISSVSGNMSCHFERSHQTTSSEEGNLVFQYSGRAMQLMMNYAGFDTIFHVPPRIFAPPHYKNDKRVMIIGRRHQNKAICNYEIALDQEYTESQTYMDFSQARLEEEGYKRYNVVSYGSKYYGIPQGEIEEFDISKVINNKKCFFGNSINEVKELIDKNLKKSEESIRISTVDDLEGDRFKYKVGCEFILQSKIEEAKKIFEDIEKRHSQPVTELTVDIFYQLGRIAKKMGNKKDAKGYCNKCLSINPKFSKAQVMLWQLEYEESPARCHEIFF